MKMTNEELTESIANGKLGDSIKEMMLDARIDGIVLGVKTECHTIQEEIDKVKAESSNKNGKLSLKDANNLIDKIRSECYINIAVANDKFAEAIKDNMSSEDKEKSVGNVEEK